MQWTIGLDRRITVIRGDSGVGKSELVSLIINPPLGVDVYSTLPCIAADNNNWNVILEGTEDSIIILDDVEAVSSSAFAKKIKDTVKNRNYFLIIGREQIGEQSLNEDNFYRLSYSVDSVLKFVISDDGKMHYTVPFFDLRGVRTSDMNIKTVLVEDSADGFKFFNHLFGDCVVSAKNGKSSVVEAIQENIGRKDSGMLVLCDMAAFGCHMDRFYYKVLIEYKNVYVDPKYECFEYLLLNTNFFKGNDEVQSILTNPYEKANIYISWEEFYKRTLERLTDKTMIKYSHGNAKFRECWIYSCDDFEENNCNMYIQQKCQFYLKGEDKIEELLKNTAFKKYLALRDILRKR